MSTEEILAVIPSEGLSILELLTHFTSEIRLQLTPLLTEKTADDIENDGQIAAPTPILPLTITAEEIRALIPPEGISMLNVVSHFRGWLSKAQMTEFSTLLKSITKYHRDSRWLTPLKKEWILV